MWSVMQRRTWPVRSLGLLGILGGAACSGAMILALFGLGGAAAVGAGAIGDMTGMSGPHTADGVLGPIVGFFVTAGPPILVVSLAALAVAAALQRVAALATVLVA